MSLRVIAGKARGVHLKLVPGETTRPIMDRVKEALFNIIGMDILDASFIDLFAGTGSVGIEALSRGAIYALLCDLEPQAIETIRANVAATRMKDRAEVRRIDAFTLLNSVPSQKFDFVYIAPPQYKGLWKQALLALDANPAWLGVGTRVIAQISPEEYEALSLTHLQLSDQRKYGSTLLLFFTTVKAAQPIASVEQPLP